MLRVLAIIAAAGFVVSAATLTVAVAITGPDNIANGAWSWSSHGWGDHHNRFSLGWNDSHDHDDDDGPQTTRDIAWNGTDSLAVDLAAKVEYTQAAGPAKLTISGPQAAVNDVEVEGGKIRYRDDHDHDTSLTITLSAPAVSSFEMAGSGDLNIKAYKQDRLVLDLPGEAKVTAQGEAKAIRLSIDGSADADLGQVKARSAKVDIAGSGDASIAPTDLADISITGSGDVTLLTNPASVQSELTGSGRVLRPGDKRSSGSEEKNEASDD
jgi:hypothetical protein